MSERPKCQLCGEPMPEGEEMFNYHGYSGPCPTPKRLSLADLDRMDVEGVPVEPATPEPPPSFRTSQIGSTIVDGPPPSGGTVTEEDRSWLTSLFAKECAPLYEVARRERILAALAARSSSAPPTREAERYQWLANRVLYCDYGDNQAPGEQIGWGIRHDLRDGQQFMFGASIDAAVDAELAKEKK